MKKIVLYFHGKGGNAEEAAHYQSLFPECDVIGVDYTAGTPWEAKEEFPKLFDALTRGYSSVILIANSIGACLSMHGLQGKPVEKAYFISPIVDMEKLITDMMGWANVTEEELREKKEIPTPFGETLSWAYLTYVREHPVRWEIPTHILYGSADDLTARETVSAFAAQEGRTLTVLDGGEHWFHTEEQMAFLDNWISQKQRRNTCLPESDL